MTKGWKSESERHSLAKNGVKTVIKTTFRYPQVTIKNISKLQDELNHNRISTSDLDKHLDYENGIPLIKADAKFVIEHLLTWFPEDLGYREKAILKSTKNDVRFIQFKDNALYGQSPKYVPVYEVYGTIYDNYDKVTEKRYFQFYQDGNQLSITG